MSMEAFEFFEQGNPFVGGLIVTYAACLGLVAKTYLQLGNKQELKNAAICAIALRKVGQPLTAVVDEVIKEDPKILMPAGKNWILIVFSALMLLSAIIAGFFKPLSKIYPFIATYGNSTYTMFFVLLVISSILLWYEYRYLLVLGRCKKEADLHADTADLVVVTRATEANKPRDPDPLTVRSTGTRRKRRAG